MAIRVIDLEITGVDSTDHVVEVGSVDLLPDGSIGKFQEHLVKAFVIVGARPPAKGLIT